MTRWCNTQTQYGWISIALHWLMALAIVAMFALGVWMVGLDYTHPWYHRAPALHKSAGILLFALLICRLLWRWLQPVPTAIGRPWEVRVAPIVHRLHYVLLFALMTTGYLIPTAQGAGIEVFDLFTLPALLNLDRAQADLVGRLHRWLAWAVIALAGLHALAALKHHFINRDATLARMLGIST